MTVTEEFDAARQANFATIKDWTKQASAGFLTCELATILARNDAVSIRRADGLPLDGPEVPPDHDMPTTGVLFRIYVPSYGALNRRHRTVLKELRNAVRHVLVRYVDDDSRPDTAYMALHQFEVRNRLDGVA